MPQTMRHHCVSEDFRDVLQLDLDLSQFMDDTSSVARAARQGRPDTEWTHEEKWT
jgi:hypothetical protein